MDLFFNQDNFEAEQFFLILHLLLYENVDKKQIDICNERFYTVVVMVLPLMQNYLENLFLKVQNRNMVPFCQYCINQIP